MGSDQAPQRLSHGRTPLSLAIRGQGVRTRLLSFSQLKVLPTESGKQGSELSLDACTHAHEYHPLPLTPHSLCREATGHRVIPGQLSLPVLTTLPWIGLFPVKNESQSPGAFSVIYREPYLHMGFPAAANPKSQREEEGENHKWIER